MKTMMIGLLALLSLNSYATESIHCLPDAEVVLGNSSLPIGNDFTNMPFDLGFEFKKVGMIGNHEAFERSPLSGGKYLGVFVLLENSKERLLFKRSSNPFDLSNAVSFTIIKSSEGLIVHGFHEWSGGDHNPTNGVNFQDYSCELR